MPVPRGSTSLDNQEYDDWLSSQKRGRELQERKLERAKALRKDYTGYLFNVDKAPIKVGGLHDLRKELDKRGLAIDGEYKRNKPDWKRT